MADSKITRQGWRLVASPFPGLCRARPTRWRQTAEPVTAQEFREFQRQCPAQRTRVHVDHQQYFALLDRLMTSAWSIGDVRIFMERRDAAMDALFPRSFFDERVLMGIWISGAFRQALAEPGKALMVQDTIRRDLAEPGSNALLLSGAGIDEQGLRAIVDGCGLPNPGCLRIGFESASRTA